MGHFAVAVQLDQPHTPSDCNQNATLRDKLIKTLWFTQVNSLKYLGKGFPNASLKYLGKGFPNASFGGETDLRHTQLLWALMSQLLIKIWFSAFQDQNLIFPHNTEDHLLTVESGQERHFYQTFFSSRSQRIFLRTYDSFLCGEKQLLLRCSRREQEHSNQEQKFRVGKMRYLKQLIHLSLEQNYSL